MSVQRVNYEIGSAQCPCHGQPYCRTADSDSHWRRFYLRSV